MMFMGLNLQRYRQGLERRLISAPANKFWAKTPALPLESAHALIRSKITEKSPFCVARLGSVELKIILWGRRIPMIGPLGLPLPTPFSDTHAGAPNAGIRPRSPGSYRTFADLAYESLKQIDLLSRWATPLEYAVLNQTQIRPALCDVEQLSPTMPNEQHWVEALDGKRILIVSPFKSSIERQIPRMQSVWPSRAWKWKADFSIQKFPYLIDDDCGRSWEDVWDEMLAVVKVGNYDVALFGCGGLGMPLAAAARAAGRIGIHMGGHLQLLFGIYGQRHQEQEWHARWINESWIRPDRKEVAQSAKRVEGGCYW